MVFRDGFDLRRHALSMLSLGDLGWIQVTNFVVTGLLVFACAVGLRRTLHPGRAGSWGPLLIGLYGVGLVAGGVFVVQPSVGFPPGAPEGMPETMAWHAIVHAVAAMTAFGSLTAACFVFLRRFAGLKQRGWAVYSAVTGLVAPGLSMWPGTDGAGIRLAIAVVLTSTWLSLLAASLLQQVTRPAGTR
jgi:hypothetical protein